MLTSALPRAAIRSQTCNHNRAPGLATEAQATAWKPVVQKVHGKGGILYAQLFHAGKQHTLTPLLYKPHMLAGCSWGFYVSVLSH